MNFSNSGEFFVGCNYWASHAGTDMWSDWRADIVEDDFKRLSERNITVLRVFPLWPVFQPIYLLRGGMNTPREYRFGEQPIPDSAAGKAGMSEEALSHFAEFCYLSEKYGIKLIVGLITGWMSGRLFVPPALEGLNVLTDPTAIMWEVRFISYFVEHFKNQEAIVAWDLGNECNCMAAVKSAEEFYVWTSNITGAIRSHDTSRPVVSGMHGNLPDNNWTIQHQAELNDFLTTHPYPYFTPHCDVDPINTIRTELHAASQTLFYRGIGGKPCFVEECGTLGPMFADEERAADFIRTNLLTLWSHDCRGFLWWCANEQSHLTHAPYDWNAVERELGLFRQDKSPKPVLNEMSKFDEFLKSLDFNHLPNRLVDGVCILTRGQDTWGAAYMSFVLAKQAGLDLEFSYSDQPIPDAPLYIMPSISGDSCISGRRLNQLLDKVRNGSVLYLSLNSGLLSPFSEFTGLKAVNRKKTGYMEKITINFDGNHLEVPLYSYFKVKLESVGAEVLATDKDGDPAFTEFDLGKGKVYFLNFPLETDLTLVSNAFAENSIYNVFYRIIKRTLPSKKVACIKNRNIGLTEHILSDNRRILVLINYDPLPVEAELTLEGDWKIRRFYRGSLNLQKNDGAVLEIIR